MDALAGMDPSFIGQALCLSNSFNRFTFHFLYTALCLTFMLCAFFCFNVFPMPRQTYVNDWDIDFDFDFDFDFDLHSLLSVL